MNKHHHSVKYIICSVFFTEICLLSSKTDNPLSILFFFLCFKRLLTLTSFISCISSHLVQVCFLAVLAEDVALLFFCKVNIVYVIFA